MSTLKQAEDGYVTYYPRTFSFCPATTIESLNAGFLACERLVSDVVYSLNDDVFADIDPVTNFTFGSVSYNYTLSVDKHRPTNELAECGPDPTLSPRSATTPDGLSCVMQVWLSPFFTPGGLDDSFLSCSYEARRRFSESYPPASVVVSVLVALYFLLPIASVLWLLVLRQQRSVAGGKQAFGKEAGGTTTRPVSAAGAAAGGAAGRVYLSFRNIYYSVYLNPSARKAKLAAAKAEGKAAKELPPMWDVKPILRDVSGAFSPGTLTAIMGPSGCGKSTLLNVLADRMKTGHTAGSVLLNGHPRGKSFKRACGYVEQSDALFGNLTVREMLAFTAELRVEGADGSAKAAAVSRVLEELDLVRVAESRIGGEGAARGISGGQARRCTVGVELVTSPSVLFLDEPTTGLDAYSSLLLVRSLRSLANSGRTILCTIHQPRPDIFALFETLLLMAAGRVAYFGPRDRMATYLGGVGVTIPAHVNPADFVVDLTYARDDACVIDDLIYWLQRRAYTNSLRAPDFVRRIFFVPLLQYLFFGFLYLGTRDERRPEAGFTSQDAALESFGSLVDWKRSFYFQIMSTAILSEASVMGEAFAEQRAFKREHAAGAYSLEAYHVQWFLRLNFRAIYKTLLFGSFVYWMPAIAPAETVGGDYRFFVFLLVMAVCSTVGSALALLFISLIPDAEGAATAHNAVAAVLLQYSGYFLIPCLMPAFVNSAYFLSFGKYALEAMLLNEFGSVPYGTRWNLFNSYLNTLDPTFTRWTNLSVLLVYPFLFHMLALLSTFLQTRPKSFWAPLEDWLHKKFPTRYPARDLLARADLATAAKPSEPAAVKSISAVSVVVNEAV